MRLAMQTDHIKTFFRVRPPPTGDWLAPFDERAAERPRAAPLPMHGAIDRHAPYTAANGGGPRRGTEFPVKADGQAEPPALSSSPQGVPAPAGRRRVLVVEDNRDSATSLSVLLELMGHEVRVAYTGPEAVAMAAEWPPEVTISDIGLPGFDGFEVARRLRCQLGKGPLLVALTGYGRDEDRRQSREAGFDHHLVKPADPAELQRMLTEKR
jgi:CheY-like chemotaxis protein